MAVPRSLSRAGAVLLLLAVSALSAATPGPQETTITISLTPAGVRVIPARATVDQGEALVWSSDLPFALAVERNAALFGQELPPQALRGRANAPARAAVARNAPADTYKYSVAVWDGENVWVIDPEIVVRPGD